MTITRSSSQEVARLLSEVTGVDPVRREAAIARLAVIGPRTLDRVVAALSVTGEHGARIALLEVLERIADPRSLGAAAACLESPEPTVGQAAVAALRPLLSARQDVATRVLDRLTEVALDTSRQGSVRAAALDALHDLGDDVLAPLCDRLKDDPNPALRRQAGWQPGPDAAGADAAGGDTTPDLEDLAASLPAEADHVRAAVAGAGSDVPLSVLHRLVVAIATRERDQRDEHAREAWAAARAAVHQALAARGSRVALYDLREMLERHDRRLPVGVIAAAAAVGDRSCLEPIAEAAARAEDEWVRAQLVQAFRHIRDRERLTKRHALIRRIDAKHPGLA